MAKTSYQIIPVELQGIYSRALCSADRFTIPRVRVKKLFFSRRRKKGITEKSLIPSLSLAWASFDQSVRDDWISAGAVCGLTGFRLFLKDTSLRIKNDLSGYSSPSVIYQALVGHLHIESPASSLLISQIHPLNYWVSRKITGTRSQFQPVQIVEEFSLPLTIKISYKSDLVSAGSNPSARFFCRIDSHYQGRIISTDVSILFNLSQNWATAEASISSVVGLVRGYSAYINLSDVRGDLYIDNLSILHSGHNWARDPFCNDINQSFTKAFYQIPKHWAPIEISEGANFESEFYY